MDAPSQYLSQGQMEYKASYDDLVDEHASAYAPNTGYQTYALPVGHSHTKPSYSSESTMNLADDGDSPRTGYPPAPVQEVDTRSFWQKILPESIACRLYVITVIIQTTIDLAIEGDLLLRFDDASASNSSSTSSSSSSSSSTPDADSQTARDVRMSVYLSVFTIAHIFQFAMALDAVYARNTLQFICLTIFNGLLLLYAVIQIYEIQALAAQFSQGDGVIRISVATLTTLLPIVISLAEVAYIALGWKIYNEFGWKVYKYLGADRRLKKMYANYQIYQCLVKFDLFFWVGFSVQLIWVVLYQKRNWEYYVTCAVLPVSLLLLIEGHLAARHENKPMMVTFMGGCGAALIYFLYKTIRIIDLKKTTFEGIWKSLTTFSGISIVLLGTTMVFCVIVLRNFGKGLKEAMDRSAAMQAGSNLPGHQRAASKHLNRMSIS